MQIFSTAVLRYYQSLRPPAHLPKGVEVLNPYQNPQTFDIASKFYHKYYHDQKERIICFGINPGRFGAGITGVPFTDPIRLAEVCDISNPFEKRAELSSRFIYDMIDAFGGTEAFYSTCYISAVSPLGYVKGGINLNYYDIKGYKTLFEEYAAREIKQQLAFGISTKVAFSIGKGKNIQFLHWLNEKHAFFEQIIPLPHPRWVMQYRLKTKETYIKEYVEKIQKSDKMRNS